MQRKDETKKLVKKFSDKARKATVLGRQALIPHKFTPNGEIVNSENFDAQRDLSKLNLNDLRFLALWRDNRWNEEETQKKSGLSPDQAVKTFKKLAYFKTEDARIRALAEEATVEKVLAKDVENLETGKLTDSHHKSLDRIAKIRGGFKASEVNTQINIFNGPRMSPETEAIMRKLGDLEADKPPVIDTQARAA